MGNLIKSMLSNPQQFSLTKLKRANPTPADWKKILIAEQESESPRESVVNYALKAMRKSEP